MGDIHPGHVGIARARAPVAADDRLLQRQRLGGRGEGQVQGVGHGAVGELAGMHVEPVAQVHVIQQCLDRALVGQGQRMGQGGVGQRDDRDVCRCKNSTLVAAPSSKAPEWLSSARAPDVVLTLKP